MALKEKVDDISENGATRLMAALAAQEIRDVFDGKGDVELAKKSLHLLLSIIADVVPNAPTSNTKELAKPAYNKPQQSICRKCSGKGYNVSLVGDGVGVQHISERKRKCRYCNGSGKQLAVQ